MAGKPFKAPTGEVTTVELPSSIQLVQWSRLAAAPGGKVSLEVRTRYVGSGSKLQIELSDADGKKHGSFRDVITNNVFSAEVVVPPRARKALVATVKLTDHGLDRTGPALLLMPPIEISRCEWDRAEVKRGDVVRLSAEVKEADDGTEAEISVWEHDDDEAHDLVSTFKTNVDGGKIDTEWEFQYVEDTDDVPTDPEVEAGYSHPEYFFRVSVGGIEADSPLMRFSDDLDIELRDERGLPISNVRYRVLLADGTERTGTLSEEGVALEKDVPPGPIEVTFPGLEDRENEQGA